MKNLKKIISLLKERKAGKKIHIPESWNCASYTDYVVSEGQPGQITVDAADFLIHNLNSILEAGKAEYAQSNEKAPLTGKVMYSMFPRMFTSWNLYDDGEMVNGSFLKATALIPYLKNLHVDIIYLLPIFKNSKLYKKGDSGSPYSIKDVYKVEPELHDDLLGDYSEELMDLQFKAFVEACHLSGIKVMVDFVFRTVARDNDMIIDHPDWFYWIDLKYKDTFQIFEVEGQKPVTLITPKTAKTLYKSENLKGYLEMFRPSPDVINKGKWEGLHEEMVNNKGEMLSLIEKHFGVTTAPAFSDVINDIQPPWSDVTYLRFYFDLHEMAGKHVSKDQVPYILQDVVKLNIFRGQQKNTELWDSIENAIPYYQKVFGIDGARIDMGHALPPELNKSIIDKTNAIDPNFILWSEEFSYKNSKEVKETGFHFITGGLRYTYKNLGKQTFNKELFEPLLHSALPLTGATETPDTPRCIQTYGDKQKVQLITWINSFIPNTVSFLNNGQELLEVQPMNLGIDNTEAGRFVLDPTDEMYGKVAFFDKYRLHWTSNDRLWMESLLKRVLGFKRSFGKLLTEKSNFRPEYFIGKDRMLTGMVYAGGQENLFFLANRDFKKVKRYTIEQLFSWEYLGGPADGKANGHKQLRILYSEAKSANTVIGLGSELELFPGEVLIGRLE